jgi:tripartite-type tricarboxylate transporter receptor subunit TctC
MKITALAIAIPLLGLAAGSTHAEYPERPIRIIVPSAPGGGPPEEFAVFVRKEVAKWTDVAKRANVRIE